VDLGTLGGDYAAAVRLNEQDEVVGFSDIATFETHAFLWRDGAMTDLGTLGGPNSEATDINSRGQIVGSADYPFMWWNEMMTPIDLVVPGYRPDFYPMGINDRGQVVMAGFGASSGYSSHAFLWTPRPAVR